MSRPFKDLVGHRFGRLKVIEQHARRTKAGAIRWWCLCDCGSITTVIGGGLKRGATKSCGCLHKERVREASTTHGMHTHPAYKAWEDMKRRCNDVNHKSYGNYGGRGIVVCERWLEGFEEFWENLGGTWKEGLSLDREDNDGNYEPSNCKWSTKSEQQCNKRSNKMVETEWGLLPLVKAAKRSGINYQTLMSRLNNGWSVDKALNTHTRNTK